MSDSIRSILRTWFIIVATLFAMVVVAPDLALPWHPWSSFGFFAEKDGAVVMVDQQSAASGLKVGDVIDVARMSPIDRARLFAVRPYAPVGSVLRVPVKPNREVTLTAHAHPRTFAENATDVVLILGLLLYAVIAATLVLLRPMPSTWAFYLFSYFFVITGSAALFGSSISAGGVIALQLIMNVAQVVGAIAFVVFALRFPNVTLVGTTQRAERILLYGVAPLLVACLIASDAAYVLFGIVQLQWIQSAFQATAIASFTAGALVLIARYVRSDDETRARLQWVVAAFSVAYLPYLLISVIARELGHVGSIVVSNILSTISVVAPIALAFTVLRHRLFDIRLVVSRALIFGALTTIIVGVLALADWGFGIWLAQARLALAAEAALALALGFSMTTLHRKIEGWLDAVIFRKQMAAMHALRRFTGEVDLIADPQRLLAQTHEALTERLEIEYAAIYAAEDAAFVRACGADRTPQMLASDDLAVLRLRRWSEPFECDEAHHPLRAALLLPMVVRNELVGFIACGQKDDRTHYLPEEVETLAALAHRVGSALAWLTLRPSVR